MKVSKYLILVFLFNGLTMQSQSLKEYRWEDRVLILVCEKKDSEALLKQQEALSAKSNKLKDRDLIFFVLKKNLIEFSNGNASQINSFELRKELKIDLTFNGAILIGKDGGVKMRREFHVEPQEIFDLIDSMPMRRAEMKN